MRIERIELSWLRIPMRRAFAHASSSRTASELVLVRVIDDEGRCGHGESLPRAYVTGETIDTVLDRDGPALAQSLLGTDLADRAGVEAWAAAWRERDDASLSALSGFEGALLDVAGQHLGFALADVLGPTRGSELPAGVIIGFDQPTDRLARYCAVLRMSGRRHVKVKVGRDDDEARLTAITSAFGPELPLRLDANEAWTADEAIERLSRLARFSIDSIEQPVPKHDLAGLRAVREATGLAVMADESVCSRVDAERLIEARAADVFNVRIGKHGGVLGARAIVDLAQAAGVRVHLGTLVGETGIGSRQAEVFGRAVPGFTCLDGKGQHGFLLAGDVLKKGDDGAVPDVGAISPDALGLGVSVDDVAVDGFRVKPCRVFGRA